MSDDVISLAPPLSVSGPVVGMFAAWRDNLISGAAANAKSRRSQGGGKKEVPGPAQLPPAVHSHPSTRGKEDHRLRLTGRSSTGPDHSGRFSAPTQPQTPRAVFFNHCGVTL